MGFARMHQNLTGDATHVRMRSAFELAVQNEKVSQHRCVEDRICDRIGCVDPVPGNDLIGQAGLEPRLVRALPLAFELHEHHLTGAREEQIGSAAPAGEDRGRGDKTNAALMAAPGRRDVRLISGKGGTPVR
jgi:hypothetical protein